MACRRSRRSSRRGRDARATGRGRRSRGQLLRTVRVQRRQRGNFRACRGARDHDAIQGGSGESPVCAKRKLAVPCPAPRCTTRRRPRRRWSTPASTSPAAQGRVCKGPAPSGRRGPRAAALRSPAAVWVSKLHRLEDRERELAINQPHTGCAVGCIRCSAGEPGRAGTSRSSEGRFGHLAGRQTSRERKAVSHGTQRIPDELAPASRRPQRRRVDVW